MNILAPEKMHRWKNDLQSKVATLDDFDSPLFQERRRESLFK